jgi:hypothetical protein
MTPKEKAEELLNKMYGETPVRSIISEIEQDRKYAKQCSIIAVNEILLNNVCTPTDYGASWTYWQQVKQEIEKL